ncbi:predicted protein [Chaetoceros tenuissimus]|uniref:Uncharacterized protein n=1 Tax=Chaetoceros tenuissimus TaxID=426638 RepID=A0AAD3GYX6_9STRA|nr:predicted protein [Chaetoceros tenuissimus]
MVPLHTRTLQSYCSHAQFLIQVRCCPWRSDSRVSSHDHGSNAFSSVLTNIFYCVHRILGCLLSSFAGKSLTSRGYILCLCYPHMIPYLRTCYDYLSPELIDHKSK